MRMLLSQSIEGGPFTCAVGAVSQWTASWSYEGVPERENPTWVLPQRTSNKLGHAPVESALTC